MKKGKTYFDNWQGWWQFSGKKNMTCGDVVVLSFLYSKRRECGNPKKGAVAIGFIMQCYPLVNIQKTIERSTICSWVNPSFLTRCLQQSSSMNMRPEMAHDLVALCCTLQWMNVDIWALCWECHLQITYYTGRRFGKYIGKIMSFPPKSGYNLPNGLYHTCFIHMSSHYSPMIINPWYPDYICLV